MKNYKVIAGSKAPPYRILFVSIFRVLSKVIKAQSDHKKRYKIYKDLLFTNLVYLIKT